MIRLLLIFAAGALYGHHYASVKVDRIAAWRTIHTLEQARDGATIYLDGKQYQLEEMPT